MTVAMHPAARAFIEKMVALAPTPLYRMSAEDARRAFNERSPKLVLPTRLCNTIDTVFTGSTPDVRVRIYKPYEGDASVRPALVYFHGGGWVVGDLNMVDALCHDLCRQSGAIVISVDYRLAPEHPFPAPLDDAQLVLHYIREHASELAIDPDSLFVGGDSAGGNIAAVIALTESFAHRQLAGQVLIYPATDLSKEHPSMQRLGEGLNLDRATMKWFTEAYQPDEQMRNDWRLSPLLAKIPQPLTKTLLITAGFDPLHDEGAAYANHLAQAGTPVEYLCFASQIHGFANQTALSTDAYTLRDVVAGFIKRHAPRWD